MRCMRTGENSSAKLGLNAACNDCNLNETRHAHILKTFFAECALFSFRASFSYLSPCSWLLRPTKKR